jgi:hypothetical protein
MIENVLLFFKPPLTELTQLGEWWHGRLDFEKRCCKSEDF